MILVISFLISLFVIVIAHLMIYKRMRRNELARYLVCTASLLASVRMVDYLRDFPGDTEVKITVDSSDGYTKYIELRDYRSFVAEISKFYRTDGYIRKDLTETD